MFIKTESIKNKHLKRVLEHAIYLAILFVLIPGFVYFEINIVLPTLIEEWSTQHIIHLFFAAFFLFNIIGNMLCGMLISSSIKGKMLYTAESTPDWSLCAVCECMRPPRAWHCDMCDICVLKRDHHCTFLATCVGYHNQRYFMLFVFHIFLSMIYAFYYNVQFLSGFITWNHGLVIFKFVFPLASFAFDFGPETLYVFLVVINFIVGAFTGYLFFYHLDNVIKGITTPEAKHTSNDLIYNQGWKLNLIEVFGSRWYLTWLYPFISSPLPGNGIKWVKTSKTE